MNPNLKVLGAGGLLLLFLAGAAAWHFQRSAHNQPPIKVGILHSMSGAMAISEKSMVDGELLAIEEINARGGLLGRRIDPVIADGKSDWPTFAQQAERLIQQEHVNAIFGCWTSASRKNVKPVIERYKHLLIYPMAYEGLELSPYIIYTGAAPNQQIIPAVKWSFDKIGKRFFLVGSDYVWPHSVNAIIKDELTALGAELLGEEYIFFGSSDVQRVIKAIVAAHPDVIISAVVGDSNIAFYKGLQQAGITSDTIPVVSVSIGEDELRKMPANEMAGNYCAWNYFQSISRPENEAFVKNFKARYGAERVTADVIESSYFSVLLWAQAVQECGTAEVHNVRDAMRGQSLDAPEGVVSIDPETQHTWRSFSVGKIRSDGQLDVVWTSQKPIRPVPYPISRSKAEWDSFLSGLYTQWGGKWANPVNSH
jgi:urea transport system substrate-binding protein